MRDELAEQQATRAQIVGPRLDKSTLSQDRRRSA